MENPDGSFRSDDKIVSDMDQLKEYLNDKVVSVKAVNLIKNGGVVQ